MIDCYCLLFFWQSFWCVKIGSNFSKSATGMAAKERNPPDRPDDDPDFGMNGIRVDNIVAKNHRGDFERMLIGTVFEKCYHCICLGRIPAKCSPECSSVVRGHASLHNHIAKFHREAYIELCR